MWFDTSSSDMTKAFPQLHTSVICFKFRETELSSQDMRRYISRFRDLLRNRRNAGLGPRSLKLDFSNCAGPKTKVDKLCRRGRLNEVVDDFSYILPI